MRTFLCVLAIAIHGAMIPFGPGAILCIGADGHVALEDGTAPCCGPGEGHAAAMPAAPDRCCPAPASTGSCPAPQLAGSPEPPCAGCRDIALAISGAKVHRPQPSSSELPALAWWSVAGWMAPPPAPAVGHLSPRSPRPGWRALADRMTVVQRC